MKISMGKSTINGRCSIATFACWRVAMELVKPKPISFQGQKRREDGSRTPTLRRLLSRGFKWRKTKMGWKSHPNRHLVGGLEHVFSISWEFHHPNWRTHVFQRDRAQPPTRHGCYRLCMAPPKTFHLFQHALPTLGASKKLWSQWYQQLVQQGCFYRILSDGLTQLPSTYSKSGKNSIRW